MLVHETYEPGMSVSLVARKHGVGESQLFNWRKLEREGALTAVTAGEIGVPVSKLAAARALIAQNAEHAWQEGNGSGNPKGGG